MIPSKIKEDRTRFLSYLRENPSNYHQIEVYLTDFNTGRCATGMAAEALKIPMGICYDDPVYNDVYEEVAERLDCDASEIWGLNDGGMTFMEIADALEARWAYFERQDEERAKESAPMDVPVS